MSHPPLELEKIDASRPTSRPSRDMGSSLPTKPIQLRNNFLPALRKNCDCGLPARCLNSFPLPLAAGLDHEEAKVTQLICFCLVSGPNQLLHPLGCCRRHSHGRRWTNEGLIFFFNQEVKACPTSIGAKIRQIDVFDGTGALPHVCHNKAYAVIRITLKRSHQFRLRWKNPRSYERKSDGNCREGRKYHWQCADRPIECTPPALASLAMFADRSLHRDAGRATGTCFGFTHQGSCSLGKLLGNQREDLFKLQECVSERGEATFCGGER